MDTCKFPANSFYCQTFSVLPASRCMGSVIFSKTHQKQHPCHLKLCKYVTPDEIEPPLSVKRNK